MVDFKRGLHRNVGLGLGGNRCDYGRESDELRGVRGREPVGHGVLQGREDAPGLAAAALLDPPRNLPHHEEVR